VVRQISGLFALHAASRVGPAAAREMSTPAPIVIPTTLDAAQQKKLIRHMLLYNLEDIGKESMIFMSGDKDKYGAENKPWTDEEAAHMAVALKMLAPTNTEYIVLPGGKNAGDAMVGDATAKTLGDAIGAGCCPKLQVVIMQGTELTDAGLSALVKGLGKCPHFRDLTVACNKISDVGFKSLVDVFLSGAFDKVERLNISGEMFLKHDITDASALPFAKALAEGDIKLLDLKELNFQDTMIGDETVSLIGLALGRGNLPKLENLYLMGCPKLTDASAKAIADGINARKRMPMLRDIRLGYTEVTKAGKELIKDAARAKGKKISVILQLLGGELPDKD